jgi:autotransporter-associated beta strand protein
MQRSKKLLIATAAAAAVGQWSLVQFTASAASFTWNGAGADNNLSSGANWIGGAAPGTADFAVFTGSTRTTPVVDTARQQSGVIFDSLASAFTLGGSNTLTLGAGPSTAGSIVNNSTVVQTFNNPVALYAGTITANTAGLVFNAPVNFGNGGTVTANSVRVTGNSTIAFNGGLVSSINLGSTALNIGGPVSGGNDVASTFNGTLTVGTDNSALAGNVFINGGTTLISNGNALGNTGTIEIALSSGGTGKGELDLAGGITVNKNVITRARSANANVELRNISGNNTITNVFTGTGGSTFSYASAGGNLTITNWNTAGTGGARFLDLSGAGNGQISNWTPASGTTVGINKNGTGNWTMGAGMSAGTFAALNVNAGTLTLDGGVGARAMGPATISNGATVVVVAPDGQTGEIGFNAASNTSSTVTVKSGGTLDASSFTTQYSLQPSQTLVAGGTVKAGTLAAFGDNPIHIGDSSAPGAGTLNVIGNLSLSNAFAPSPSNGGGLHFDLGNVTTVGGVNDLLSVQGDLLVDNSSGPINLFVNPLSSSGFANGTYRLIDYTGGSIPSPSSFAVTGASGGQTRQVLNVATEANHVNLVVSGNPASLVWKGDGSGNAWDVVGATNWLNGATPDKFFQFDSVTFDDTTANTNVNIGTLVVPSAITVNTAQTYTLAGTGTISGSTGITKSGAGTLIIANSGINDFTGAVTINSGTLQIGSGGADGNIGGGTLTNNGNLVVNKSAGVTIAGSISGTGALINRGSGVLALTGSSTYSGATTVEAGAIQFNNSNALGDVVAGTTVNAGGQLFASAGINTAEPLTLNGESATAGDGALRAGGAASSTFSGAVTLAGNTTLKVDGGATMNLTNSITGSNTTLTLNGDSGGTGVISGSVSLGSGGITKNGAATWVLANPSIVYGGPTAINAGVLQYGNGTTTGNATLPTAPITLTGGTIAFNNTGSYAVATNISGTGGVAIGNGGGTATLTGDLTGFTGLLTTLNGGTNSMLVVPVATGATGVQITDTNLGGGGQGIIRLTNSNAINSSGVATMDIQASQAGGTGRLEVGNSVTLNFGSIILHPRNNNTTTILATDGNNTINGPMRVNTGGTTVSFLAGAGASLTFTGTIRPAGTGEGDVPGTSRALLLGGDGNGTFSGNITNRPDLATTVGILVVKNGSGTWRLTGTNDYVGNVSNGALPTNAATIVQGGALILVGAGAQAPVLSNTNTSAYTDIQGGRLVLDYNGGASPAGTIQTALTTAYPGNFSTGPIRSTTATTTKGLGWKGDTTAHQVTVMYTYFGDANLDGTVDTLDFNSLAANFGGTNKVWNQADFNYDGVVDTLDFNNLAANFGKANPQPDAGVSSSSSSIGSLVPEPASAAMALLALGAITGIAPVRRRIRPHSSPVS